MTRRVPILATVIVLVAAGIMVALGFWQLARMEQKEALLARYARAATMSADVRWPSAKEDYPYVLYRHTRIACREVESMSAIAGRSRDGRAGWAPIANCNLGGRQVAAVALGWSDRPGIPKWSGGEVGGFIAPGGDAIRLIASPAQAGLAELAPPDPSDIPNNHLAYAVQWFLFAATALVIYALALRKKWAAASRD